jgi:hypothetical protein
VLCAFYQALDGDDVFWDAVAGLVGLSPAVRFTVVP